MNLEMFPSAHLAGVHPAPQFASLAEQAKAAEAWETAPWAAAAILEVELLSAIVVDPCCGTGILSEAAQRKGYDVRAADLYDWGYSGAHALGEDFLTSPMLAHWCHGNTVFMNPPFSKATAFVDRALESGARKVVCYQRHAWRESDKRRDWWAANRPARVWVCGDRATSWLFTITPEERAERSGTATAHAWFVWERGHAPAELMGAIYRDMHR